MGKPKRRRLKEKPAAATTTTTDMDRISSLPNSLLCYILSFLPTRTSVATSILSRRWRHVWKDLQVFDFSNISFSEPEADRHFIAFVNAVLAQRSALHIQKFRLSCKAETKDECDAAWTWIDAATGPHIQELHLFISNPSGEEFRLRPSIFTCNALVSLTLVGDILVERLPPVDLPSLKKLEMNILGLSSIDELFTRSPKLETLKLTFHYCNAPTFHVPPSLKSLTFEDDSSLSVIDDFVIDAPSLEFVDIKIKNKCLQFLGNNLHNVVEAHVKIWSVDENVGFAIDLLKALSKTKFLALKRPTTECLLRAPPQDIPAFSCLLHLQLDIPYFNSRLLMTMLHNCYMLQVVQIHNRKREPDDWNQILPSTGPSRATLLPNVPYCVMSHLTTFEFREYEDSADEHELAVCILETGFVLKTMTIHTTVSMGPKKKLHILKGLSLIQRGSNMCRLQFD